jgi:hypothetical protein
MELSTTQEAALYETCRFITAFTRAFPLVLILSQTNPAHTTRSYLCKINLNIIINIIYVLVFLVALSLCLSHQ